jgi:hypothetical protein
MAISCRVQAFQDYGDYKTEGPTTPPRAARLRVWWVDYNGHGGAAAPRAYATLGIFVEFAFGDWELVSVFGDPDVQRGEQENAEQQSTDQAADDDYGEGTL